MRTLFEELRYEVKNWWVSLVLGILLIGLSLFMIFSPITGYETIAILFCVIMIASGIMEIFFAASNRKVLSDWGWFLAAGIIDLILGLAIFIIPGMKEAILPFILAFWLMFRGISGIGFSIELHRYGSKSWGWYLAIGIISVLCSIGVIFFPMVGAVSVVWIISFILLFSGISQIMLAFDLKRLYNESQDLKKRFDRE